MNTFSKTNSDMVYIIKFSDGTYFTGNPQLKARTSEIDNAKTYYHIPMIKGDFLLDNYISIDPTNNKYEIVPMEINITVEKRELHVG